VTLPGGTTRSPAAWAAVVAVLIAGCASPPPAPPPQPVEPRIPAMPADPERRAQVRLELAAAYFARGQSATALEELNLALAAKPDLPEAYNLRGLVHASLGDHKQAEENFRRALAVRPGDADAMHNYGWFLCQTGRPDEAQAQFQAAVAVPQYVGLPRTLLAQGVCQARAGRWMEAERALQRSFELDPGNPATAFNLAEVLFRRGDFERARFYVRRVNTQPDQSNAQSLWLASRIERRAGNYPAADDFGRQLRDRYPNSPEALRLQRGQFDD
jgi:type IV pilus assembly protein PilF